METKLKARCVVLALPVAIFALAVGSSALAMGDPPPKEGKVVQKIPVPQKVDGPDLRRVHPPSDPVNPLYNPTEIFTLPGAPASGGGGGSPTDVCNQIPSPCIRK